LLRKTQILRKTQLAINISSPVSISVAKQQQSALLTFSQTEYCNLSCARFNHKTRLIIDHLERANIASNGSANHWLKQHCPKGERENAQHSLPRALLVDQCHRNYELCKSNHVFL